MLTAEKPSWQFCSAFVPNSFLSPRGTGLLISKHSVWHDKGKEAPFQAGVVQEGGGTQTPDSSSKQFSYLLRILYDNPSNSALQGRK